MQKAEIGVIQIEGEIIVYCNNSGRNEIKIVMQPNSIEDWFFGLCIFFRIEIMLIKKIYHPYRMLPAMN